MRCRMPGSVFDIGSFYTGPHSSICIPPQAPPAGHGQPEAHRNNIAPPLGSSIGPGRVEDPHRVDMAYQGIVDYRPQPLAVSIFHLSATEPPCHLRRLGNRILHIYFLMKDTPKVSMHKTNPPL